MFKLTPHAYLGKFDQEVSRLMLDYYPSDQSFVVLLCLLPSIETMMIIFTLSLLLISWIRKSATLSNLSTNRSNPVSNEYRLGKPVTKPLSAISASTNSLPLSTTLATNSQTARLRNYAFLSSSIVLTGVSTAYLVTTAKHAIMAIDRIRIRSPYHSIALPLVGGCVVALLHHINSYLSASGPIMLYKDQAEINFLAHYIRILGVIVTIGSGCSLAFVGPAAEIGMALSRLYERLFVKLWRPDKTFVQACTPLLCAAGSAAGVGANFDAIFGGVAFATEVTRRFDPTAEPSPLLPTRWTTWLTRGRLLALLVISASCGAAASVWWLRDKPIWSMPTLKFLRCVKFITPDASPSQQDLLESLAVYAVVGAVSGAVAAWFNATRDWFTGLYHRIPYARSRSLLIAPVLAAGYCSLLAALGRPQAMSAGFGQMTSLMEGTAGAAKSSPAGLMLSLIERVSAAAACASSGLFGGVFSPAIFMGMSVGALFQHLHPVTALLHRRGALQPRALLVTLGSAGVLSGVFHAPVTAVALFLDLTRDPLFVVPITVTCTVASVVGSTLTRAWPANRAKRGLK